ncbi:MAG: RlmE family RNA methyltransferase [Burkholderiaceae bacterium]|jgi:23S rRNA (uridine2552-2'-O)-methyltransferase|nr:RlmE family RNA methyltransferase [Burkholderiaceae bacterium]
MAKNKFNKSWMNSHLNDPWVKLAQKENYRSRAAYKLKEIDEDAGLLKSGQVVVDLGASPGSWSQYAVRKMGRQGEDIKGEVIGIDLLPMEAISGVRFLQGDFREEEVLMQLEAMLEGRKADIILSDMAPNLSGIASTDAARMEDLMDIALDFALAHLKPEGALLVKCFNGLGYNEILAKFRAQFQSVISKKPKASRSQSPEIYLLGRRLKARGTV